MSSYDPEPPLEDQKKGVLPYLTRAQEIQGSEPKVAYYCRLYAVDQAMKFPRRAKEIGELMLSTFAKLEKDKRQLTLDFENDRWHCEAFATKIFNNADRADRAGRADLNTAKAFYASAYFLAMLTQFGDMQPDIVEKQKYAGWRAAEIRKAIREGRPPLPPAGQVPAAASSAELAGELDALSVGSGASLRRELADGHAPPAASSSAQGGASGASVWPPPAAAAGASVWPPQQQPAAAAQRRVSASGQAPNATLRSLSPPPTAEQVGGTLAPSQFSVGSRLMVRAEDGSLQQGTVGQVMRGPDGERRYKVALADRFITVLESDLVPLVPDGRSSEPARPSSYLVGTMDQSLQPDERAAAGRWDSDERRVTSKIIPPSIVQILPPPSWPSRPPPATEDTHAPQPPLYQAPSQQPPQYQSPPPHYSPPYSQSPPPQPPPMRAQSPPPAAPPPHQTQHWQGGGGMVVGHAPVVHAAPLPVLPVATANGKASLVTITAAQKAAKHAVSALSFEDIPTAVRCLQEALALLTQK